MTNRLQTEAGVTLTSGIVKFYSLEDMRKYLKGLLDTYQVEFDKTSNIVGSMLRLDDHKSMEVIISRGWAKAGGIYINTADAKKGRIEIVFQIVSELKPKVAKTEEVLKTFDAVEQLPLPEEAVFLLYLHGGVPERIVVDSTEGRPERLTYSGALEAVEEA